MYICHKKRRRPWVFMVLPLELRGSDDLKASFFKGLCNGCAYIDHFRTCIVEQIPSDGHTPLLLWNYPEHQPGCAEGSNLRLWAWQVLLLWRTHTRPSKLPTHHYSQSQAPRLCGSSPSCSSKTDSFPVDTGSEQLTLSAWKQMLLPLF